MDLSKYRYRATFEAIASITHISKDERQLATASLAPLRSLLPEGIDPQADPDLLYISANGAVAGLCNKNDDAVDNATALMIHRSCKNKYIDVDHSRDDICGVILYPGLSKFGTNEPLSDNDAAQLKEPFNMSFAGVIWKAVNPMIAGYIAKQGDSEGKDSLSMSWEILFDQYSIGVGSKNIFEARVITPDDASFAVYEKKLRCNGGEGKDDKGQDVYRIISGDAILLGYSVVRNPAATVKGILPIEAIPAIPTKENTESASDMKIQLSQDQIDTIAKSVADALEKKVPAAASISKEEKVSSENSQEKNANSQSVSVTVNTASTMKIENLEQLEATLGTHEATAAVVDFVKAIQSASEQFSKDVQAKEDMLKNAEQAKAENEKRAKELEASLAEVKKELTELRAAQEAAEANQKFQDRMASFDEKFELDAEDRKLIAADIKDLDDTAFDAYAAKCEKLMGAKKKTAKKASKCEKEEEMEDEEAKKAKAAADAAAEAAKAKEAIASVKEEAGQKFPNSVVVDEDLKARTAAAFGSSVLVNGKTVNQIKAEKAEKEKK